MCSFDCDYECKNKVGRSFLGKNCEFAEVDLDCNTEFIGLGVNNDVLSYHRANGLTLGSQCAFSSHSGFQKMKLNRAEFASCGNRVYVNNDGELVVENDAQLSNPIETDNTLPIFVDNVSLK